MSVRYHTLPSAALCEQTVTVYHMVYNPFSCQRSVLTGVYFSVRQQRTVDKTGAKPQTGCRLIVPQASGLRVAPNAPVHSGCYVLESGDKVMPGVGPVIQSREDVSVLLPALGPAVTLAWVEQKYLHGQPCHVEAGN